MTSSTSNDAQTVKVTGKYLNALRRTAGLHIDPETAEVEWTSSDTRPIRRWDRPPGGIPASWTGILRPFSWEWRMDQLRCLPEVTRTKLWEKRKSQLVGLCGRASHDHSPTHPDDETQVANMRTSLKGWVRKKNAASEPMEVGAPREGHDTHVNLASDSDSHRQPQ
jgi:hypothetical protein